MQKFTIVAPSKISIFWKEKFEKKRKKVKITTIKIKNCECNSLTQFTMGS